MVAFWGDKAYWVEPVGDKPASKRKRALYFMLGYAALNGGWRVPPIMTTVAAVSERPYRIKALYYKLVELGLIYKVPDVHMFKIKDAEALRTYVDELT